MAQAEQIHIAHDGLMAWVRTYVHEFKAEFARRRLYRKTVRELNTLTAGELADLGLNRSMIRNLAREAVYGG